MRRVLGTLAILTLCVGTTWAGIISVDVNDGACVSGSGQPDPYAVVYCSIQDAIDDATAGDRINVAAGTYNEQARITKSVTVVGYGVVVIDPNGLQFEGPWTGDDMVRAAVTFETGSDGAVLQNVTLQNSNASDLNGNAGIEVIDGEIDNVTVRNVIVDGVSGHGFGAYHPDHTWPPGSGWLIESCSFSTDATGTWSGLRPENMNNLTIRYCDVGPTNYGGILLVQANVAEVRGCKVHDVQRAGIQVDAYCTDTIDVLENEVWNANLENADGYSDIRMYAGQENPHGNTPATITIQDNVLRDGVNGICAKYGDLSTRTDVIIQGNAFIHHTGYAVLNLAIGTLDAENNWWQSTDGPEDVDSGTNEVTLATCDSYTVSEMLNAVAENTGELGGAVSDEVDYCPWLDSFARLTLDADAECYSVGDTVTVGIWMRDITQTIVSGQFFLEYDEVKLDFQNVTFGDTPFTVTVFSSVDEVAGTIDYAVGLPEGGTGTSADTKMAVITFEALSLICSEENLVSFRQHTPPSRLGDDTSTPVYPLLVAMDVYDDIPPTATQGTIDICYPSAAAAEAAAIAATTDPTDNCSDSADIVLTADTVGDCSATVTVTVTDECGNFTEYVYNTRVDGTPPTATQGTINACYDTVAEAETAALAATTDPADNCSAIENINITVATVGDCDAVVTVTVTDECGNFTDYDYNTRIDNENPVVTPPDDISVHADAGLCTASVDPGTATAVDNCTATLTVTGTRDDELELSDPYPPGITTITWETTDECGNTGSDIQTVTVSDYNELVTDVELKAVSEASLTRCITFEFWNCGSGTAETVSQEITFVNGLATNVSVDVPCGVYDCLRARDSLHTLWRTDLDVFGIAGAQYVAGFTDASGTGGDDDALVGGNLFDDEPPYAPPQFIDIMDYAVFINNWAVNYGTGDTTCTTPWPHADISGDGEVTTADFTFIQTYFLYTDDPSCCGFLGGGLGPRTTISIAELDELGLPELTVADLNYDGWVDEADIVAFLNGVRPHRPGLIDIAPAGHNGQEKSGRTLGRDAEELHRP